MISREQSIYFVIVVEVVRIRSLRRGVVVAWCVVAWCIVVRNGWCISGGLRLVQLLVQLELRCLRLEIAECGQ